MSQINTVVGNIVEDMRIKMTLLNGYSAKPIIYKGTNTVQRPSFPFIEVIVDNPSLEQLIGTNVILKTPLMFACHTKALQHDDNDAAFNNFIEDMLYYLINDDDPDNEIYGSAYSNQLIINPSIETYFGHLERGDSILSFIIKAELELQYTKTGLRA